MTTKLTYRQLQQELKEFKTKKLSSIPLNSKKAVLEQEYNRLMNEEKETQAVAVTMTEEKETQAVAVTKPEEKEAQPLAITEVEPIIFEESDKKSKDIITPEKENEPLKIDSQRVIDSHSEKITNNEVEPEKLEILKAIFLVFVRVVIKVLIKPNYFNRIIKKVGTEVKEFMRWYWQGFRLPQFA